ncbi:MAG: transcriptional regulator, MarR family [Acidobacteriaceae bacterium]|nr:transcriptional regulator, MarR family [Acidobacteriaceae bacterium]
MSKSDMGRGEIPRNGSAAFLLAQLGAYASGEFAKRLEPLGLTPAHAGIFRIMAANPGLSQQELAAKLGMYASRLVAVIDDLEKRGLIERQPSNTDRRLYALHLTKSGKEQLSAIGAIAREHGRDLLEALSDEERSTLTALLERVANNKGLQKGVHPGYRNIPEGTGPKGERGKGKT